MSEMDWYFILTALFTVSCSFLLGFMVCDHINDRRKP